ncbi:uncharacterized protein LOC125719313 [Brienomyrus brachyistius]|uniref:uncharacterized protein LOC125719313 n=1 Tax=Brienomyrus brachyistius TaxID=42636 RepID=UPI0020B2186B|nr:uncharacterized protein LOC125719313 [Brienomyrus brachyistius]
MACFDNQNQGGGSSLEDSMARIKLLNEGSTLITEGPPERRLLNTSKQEIDEQGNIRRWTFGVKNPRKMMKTIVLLGETGIGKSTLINAMTNYILGTEWSDKIRYEIVKEKVRDQTESQTSEVNVYEIFGYEDIRVPFSLRIIDTPGYGDINGESKAKKIAETLCYLIQCEDGVHQLDAVCLVVKASQYRLTPHQRCIFDAVLSLFGKDIKKNIIPVITFSGGGKPAALAAIDKFGFSWCRDEKDNLVHFRFDNTPEEEDDVDTSPDYLENAWDKRKKTMGDFFKYLNALETRSLVMTHKVLLEHEKLERCVKSLQDQIVKAEHKQNEIRQTQEALEKNKEEIQEKKNFEYVVKQSFADKVESDSYATSPYVTVTYMDSEGTITHTDP